MVGEKGTESQGRGSRGVKPHTTPQPGPHTQSESPSSDTGGGGCSGIVQGLSGAIILVQGGKGGLKGSGGGGCSEGTRGCLWQGKQGGKHTGRGLILHVHPPQCQDAKEGCRGEGVQGLDRRGKG